MAIKYILKCFPPPKRGVTEPQNTLPDHPYDDVLYNTKIEDGEDGGEGDEGEEEEEK